LQKVAIVDEPLQENLIAEIGGAIETDRRVVVLR
jgi:hypothetical protein